MKTTLESKNLSEKFSNRQREAEVLTQLVQHDPKFARAAEDALAKRYAHEMKCWSKALFYWNSGRSYGLTLADFESAAMFGLLKAAKDYDPTNGATFKTWLCHNVRSFCSDIAKRNEILLKREVQENRLAINGNDDEVKNISIEELSGDDRFAPKSLALSSRYMYNNAQILVERMIKALQDIALYGQKKERNKAERVLDYIDFFSKKSEVKEDFLENNGCSPTTLNNNIKELTNSSLKEIKEIVTRYHSKFRKKQEASVMQALVA